MEGDEFRRRGREMVDYIADYLESISERRVRASIEPGYLRPLMPDTAPVRGESWEAIMKDIERVVMPGITHWQHPRFHAYYPAAVSYPSILADMLTSSLGCMGFSWATSPVITELETMMLDWLAKMIGLTDGFLSTAASGNGGGVLQGSASDCVHMSMIAARHRMLKAVKQKNPEVDEAFVLAHLVAYCSEEAHSCVEKAAILCMVKLHLLESDDRCRLRGPTLAKAVAKDRQQGLVPFYVCCTLGTTSCCSFDALDEIGPVCREEDIWLNVDSAYAGSSFICPEFRHLLQGVECADSFNTNPNKFMLVNFDCSAMWLQDRTSILDVLTVDPLYLHHEYSDVCIDYMHWGIPLSRRFRALKLWFTIRNYGIEGLQKYQREHVRLAKVFERLVRQDSRFEVMNDVILGLVCIRLKGSNELNHQLLSAINDSGKLHMVSSMMKKHYVIRFCVCARKPLDKDMEYAWRVISAFATKLLLVLKYCKILKKAKQKKITEASM